MSNKDIRIKRDGNNAIVERDNIAFTYSIMEDPRDLVELRTKEESFSWEGYQYARINNFVIHPFGTNNNLPNVIRNIIQENYIAPGLLNKKKQLLWGDGPKLYSEVVQDKEIYKDWRDRKDKDAKEIYKWLYSWDFEQYLEECATTYQYMQGVFTKFISNRGARIGKGFINKLEHISHEHCRMASVITNDTHWPLNRYIKPTHAVLTDYSFSHINSLIDYKDYELFDKDKPFKNKISVGYSRTATFLQDIYTLPDIYGALEWIKRSTAVPLILKALSMNGINLTFHIESPQKYWEDIQNKLMEKASSEGRIYNSSELQEYETNIMRQISDSLSGVENAGKFIHTKKILEVDGSNLLEHGWTIKPIEQNLKDFVEAQTKISSKSDYAVSAAINIHSALGNISESGKSDSGSEQLYAYMIYLLTANNLPEMIVCKHINQAIMVNFPNTDLRIGFYHTQPNRQSDVSSKDRINNKIQ